VRAAIVLAVGRTTDENRLLGATAPNETRPLSWQSCRPITAFERRKLEERRANERVNRRSGAKAFLSAAAGRLAAIAHGYACIAEGLFQRVRSAWPRRPLRAAVDHDA